MYTTVGDKTRERAAWEAWQHTILSLCSPRESEQINVPSKHTDGPHGTESRSVLALCSRADGGIQRFRRLISLNTLRHNVFDDFEQASLSCQRVRVVSVTGAIYIHNVSYNAGFVEEILPAHNTYERFLGSFSISYAQGVSCGKNVFCATPLNQRKRLHGASTTVLTLQALPMVPAPNVRDHQIRVPAPVHIQRQPMVAEPPFPLTPRSFEVLRSGNTPKIGERKNRKFGKVKLEAVLHTVRFATQFSWTLQVRAFFLSWWRSD